jgi:hypothetical protein
MRALLTVEQWHLAGCNQIVGAHHSVYVRLDLTSLFDKRAARLGRLRY